MKRAYEIRHEVVKRLKRGETVDRILRKGDERGIDTVVEYCKALEQRKDAAVDALIRMKKECKQLRKIIKSPPLKDAIVYLAPVMAFTIWVALSLWSWKN